MRNDTGLRSYFSRGIRRGSLFFLSFGFALLFLMAPAASAQNTLTVIGGATVVCSNEGAGAYNCPTLSAAITQANADNAGDTIQFASTAYGTIDVSSALDITAPMNIKGPGANLLTLSGGGTTPILNIDLSGTAGGTVTVSGLTFANGVGIIPTNLTYSQGGAILDYGTNSTSTTASLIVDDCAFTGNSAVAGSAIALLVGTNSPTTLAYLTIANSTFSGNTSGSATYTGPGATVLTNVTGQSLTVVNSTFVDNPNLDGDAALVDNNGSGNLKVVNSTFVGNPVGDIDGSGDSSSRILVVENDIFADTTSGLAVDLASPTEGNNLFYSNASDANFTLNSSDLSSATTPGINLDPQLTALGYFGGSTQTMMPEPNSLVICAGSATDLTNVLNALPRDLSSSNDQRGFPFSTTTCTNPFTTTTVSGGADIGAVQTNYTLVTSNADSGTGSLRAAITTASGQNYTDIGFNLTPGTPAAIALSSSLPVTNAAVSVAIVGPSGGLSISGGGAAQILFVGSLSGPTSASLALYGLTFTDGSITSTSPGNSSDDGGAIYFNSTGFLSVGSCTFTGNLSAGNGGAIADAGGVLAVNDSTFSGNQATGSSADGGAIAVSAGSSTFASLSVVNSTFDANSAADTGGAIYGSMPDNGGQLAVLDSTFDGNSAASGSGAIDDSASASTSAGPETVENNIFSGNTEGSSTNDYAVDLANNTGTVENYNLYYENYETGTTTESDTNVSYGSGDVTGNDPQLTALADFGGLTQTMMPEPSSKAIGAGSASDVPAIANGADQRGFPVTTAVDIGAVQTNYLVVSTASDTSDGSSSACDAAGDSPCSLPDAITTANTQNYTDIGFSLGASPATINLCPAGGCGSSALLLTQGNTAMVGVPGMVTISGNRSVQILYIDTPSTAFVSLYGLTLENGVTVASGGAIELFPYNPDATGTLAVTDCTFGSDNAYTAGGAIFNAGGTVTVTGSTFGGVSTNGLLPVGSGYYGGAIANGSSSTEPGGTLTVTNSTFAFNGTGIGTGSGTGDGGAIYSIGSASNPATLTVTNDTFADTVSDNQGSIIYNDADSTMTLADNIIFDGNGNGANSGGSGYAIYNAGTIPTGGEEYNFFNDNYSGDMNFGYGTGDVEAPNSNITYPIGYPADNGGPTQTTLPLPSGAPSGTAICAGTANLPFGLALPVTDQRGFPRLNTTYTGFSASSPCVDIGSVQTNYQSIQFTNAPTSGYTGITGVDVSPAPVISVTESGQNIGQVPVTLSVGNLTAPAVTGNVNIPTAAGTGATFSSLIVNAPSTTPYPLSSTLAITPNISIQTQTSPTLTVTGLEFTSAASTTFTVNQPNTFTVQTTAVSTGTPTLSATTGLPSWATFTDNTDGTATITGKPKHPDVGTYKITITARSGLASITQDFALTVDLSSNTAPAFTSPTSAAFLLNQFGTFTVTATGNPTPTLTETSGSLPTGLNFTDNGNGTATISGTPTQTGSFSITITATNASGTVTQTLNVTVGTTPTVITSGNIATFTVGQPGSFTVTASGSPTPSLSESGALPAGVSFTDTGNGTATISGTPKHHAFAGSPYTFTITASNGVSPAATQIFTLTVN